MPQTPTRLLTPTRLVRIVYTHDFETDPGLEMYGSAYYDADNRYLVLTEPVNDQGAAVWFPIDLNALGIRRFVARFKYRIGGGTGADGIVFMFFHNKVTDPATGGKIGFCNKDGSACEGYGVQFDCWKNDLDPSERHVAIIKDSVDNHLAYYNTDKVEDNEWHDVVDYVEADTGRIVVFLDGEKIIDYDAGSPLDTAYGYVGFGAGTGGATNWHVVKGFALYSVELGTGHELVPRLGTPAPSRIISPPLR
ncbi:MAG: hypothetical protein DRO39_06835 [Thermoprotei archaeon]|nr:MAG: hypothetical protein DRO39_06835 [Thermoprotei archaeon]